MRSLIAASALGVLLLGGTAMQASAQPAAQSPLPAGVPAAMPFNTPYGMPVTLQQAQTIVNAALAESARRNWQEACAVVEGSGRLVLFEKMDNTQYGSIAVAQDKAVSAAEYRRPTTIFNQATEHGHPYVMMLRGSSPVPGGMPIVVDGKLVGGLGCSGGTGDQDIVVASAGMKALAANH